jgi:hypothetical protein
VGVLTFNDVLKQVLQEEQEDIRHNQKHQQCMEFTLSSKCSSLQNIQVHNSLYAAISRSDTLCLILSAKLVLFFEQMLSTKLKTAYADKLV